VVESPAVVTLIYKHGYMCFRGEENLDYLELRYNPEMQGGRQIYLKYFVYLRIHFLATELNRGK